MTPNGASQLVVSVVAESRETVAALSTYFRSAGVVAHATQSIPEPGSLPDGVTALVLFPDEFDKSESVRRILALRRASPTLLLVVVSGQAHLLRPALEADEQSRLPILLTRPAFGWAILDTIRDHVRGDGA